MSNTMIIEGWGRYPQTEATVYLPRTRSICRDIVSTTSVITRGMGRSYGDSALHHTVLQTKYLDHFLAFDPHIGTLTCEAGVTIREILSLIVPYGWFVPVTPGTSLVTVGGAIASDVHGKNHHVAGTFGQHLISMELLLGNGEIVIASPRENADLFHATCGGMGLTGVILSATINLIPISSSYIEQTTIRARCLEDVCEQFEFHDKSTYSVAWLDCLTTGSQLGRSLLMIGEHATGNELSHGPQTAVNIPVDMPGIILNKHTIKAFNELYYKMAKTITRRHHYTPFFYPLDTIQNWNRLYGKHGFVQYQCVLPIAVGVAGIKHLLTKITDNGMGSFLAVLKKMGQANQNILSFPMEGYTLALDFKMNEKTRKLLSRLDLMVQEYGGRIYLTKDALMSEDMFKATYPRWQEFETVRTKYGAIGKFASRQSIRLGLQ